MKRLILLLALAMILQGCAMVQQLGDRIDGTDTRHSGVLYARCTWTYEGAEFDRCMAGEEITKPIKEVKDSK